ncbi:CK1 family protein kinase [Histomonas meleagridis]|uniref:CK1 family protein kinase n=1 Tax=Histomonas meleagridis TaxID=135588 RepID=UPI00355A2766|nr:CK1 family protein kinase [Histomonas meleagridis]KAH0802764.1 CK1 family protein kinase [Histomonas meleagridis]
MTKKDRKTFKPGRIIQGFEIIELVGQGGFGDIYYVEKIDEQGSKYAMKVEYKGSKKQALERENEFFQNLNNLPYFPKYIKYQETKRLRFLVMELLGPSITDVRKVLIGERYSISSTLRLGIEMLRAIRGFHSLGFLHRDFKPSQVLIRASRAYPIALIDFGLSRRYLDQNTQNYIEPRVQPGFVGTGKYASLNAHKGKELGRRDDLFCWFYSLVEIGCGKLPWPSVRNKTQIYEIKKDVDIVKYCNDNQLPPQFGTIYNIIQSYKLRDEPDYDLIISYLVDAMKKTNSKWTDKYEWENLPPKLLKTISAIPLKSKNPNDAPIIPKNLKRIGYETKEDKKIPENEADAGCAGCLIY